MSGNTENKSESGESVDLKYDCKRNSIYRLSKERKDYGGENFFVCAERLKRTENNGNGDIYFQL